MHTRPRPGHLVGALLLGLVTAGCGTQPAAGADPYADARPPGASASTAAGPSSTAGRAATTDARPRIVILGDSLSAGYGLLATQSYPALLQQKLDQNGADWDVVNAGISGDTSAAGLDRLDWALQGNVRILILELGANDGLRGLPVDQMQRNLGQIIARAQQRGIAVLLAGMEAPPNYGPQYTASFRKVYRDLAAQYHVPLIPFLLDRVAGISSLNQSDGIHPNPQGARIVADTVWTSLEPLLAAARPTHD
ncbi:MAG TPA: arylesterase [Vicinamibacterales bacterium]|nr:arylesterase [Vicinamibacterales bacterium]